ncbi:hypothetical protein BJ508DRAFT_302394 [Ascobolus immersus RN42]|uniref:Pentacotripeptide-repeat region of PRORP domain-containing protein n=1 Tax=Ascobolus immersus RN42 TaxID=1160509 RepID=A0A3N4IWL1_ASCIM|nr:hypothetical protein BJ508DRAFT_302394 [Ascobolus immersus RN42]
MLERLSLRLESCAGSAITRVASSAQVGIVGGALIHGLHRSTSAIAAPQSKRSLCKGGRFASQLRHASTSSAHSRRSSGSAARYGYGSCPCTQNNFYLEFLYPRGVVRTSSTIPKFPHASTCSTRTFRRYSTEAGAGSGNDGRDARAGLLEENVQTEESDVQIPDEYEAYRIRADPATLLAKPYDLQRHISACLDGASYAMANDAWNKYRPPDMELHEEFFRDESVEGFFKFLGEIEPERSAGYASLSYALSDMFLDRFRFQRLYSITNHMFEVCDLIIQQFAQKGWQASIRLSTYKQLLKCYGIQRRSRGLIALYEVFRELPDDIRAVYTNIHELNWMMECVLEAYCFLHDVRGMDMVCNDFSTFGKGLTREAYMILLEDFGHRGEVKAAAAILEEFASKWPLDNVQPIHRLMQAHMRQKNSNAAISIYDALEPLGLVPNTKVRHLIIFAYVQQGNIRAAERLFQQFRKRQPPTAAMFTTLMLFYMKIKDTAAVERLMKEAQRSGVAMHTAFRRRLLQAYAHAGNLKAAHQVLGNIIAQDGELDMKGGWSDLLGGYMRHGNQREVEIVFQKMEAAGLATDRAYDLIIRYYTQHGLNRPAAAIYLRLKKDGIPPSASQLVNIMQSRYRLRQAMFGSKLRRQDMETEHRLTMPERLDLTGGVRNLVGRSIEEARMKKDSEDKVDIVASRNEAFARLDIILQKLREVVASFDLRRPVATESLLPLYEEAFSTLERGFLEDIDDTVIGAVLFQATLDAIEFAQPDRSILSLPILVTVMEAFLQLKRYTAVQVVWQRILGLAYYYRPNRTEGQIKDDMHQNLLNSEAMQPHEWPVPDRKSLILDRFFYVLIVAASMSKNTFGLRNFYFGMEKRNYAIRTSTWNLLIRVLAVNEPLYLSLRMAEDSLTAEEAYWGDQDLRVQRGRGRENLWLEEETISTLLKMIKPFFELAEAPHEVQITDVDISHLKGDGIQRLLKDWETNFPRVYALLVSMMKKPDSGRRLMFM